MYDLIGFDAISFLRVGLRGVRVLRMLARDNGDGEWIRGQVRKPEMAMVYAIGLDIVEVARIKRDLDAYGNRFRDRILGSEERAIYERRSDKAVFLAGRFAAKEAVIKALGYRLTERPAYAVLEIVNDETGQPVLRLPEEIRAALGPVRVLISITHERTHAAAVAVITEES